MMVRIFGSGKSKKGNIMRIFKKVSIAFAFLLFGINGILGSIIFIPILLLGLHKNLRVQFFCRDVVRYSWWVYLKIIQKLRVIDYSFSPIELKHKQLIIANHPSLLDVVFLIAHLPRVNCIVKAALKKNIFLSLAIRASGYIANDSYDNVLQRSIEALENNENLLLFPEGTRTKGEIQMHKIASYLAIHHANTMGLFYIHMNPLWLRKEDQWYEMPLEVLKYKILLIKELDIKTFCQDKYPTLRIRELHYLINSLYRDYQIQGVKSE